MSLAKLKNHATCGVTLSMKNCFGITPASIYGDDSGVDEPNESPTKGRGAVCHSGKRGPSKSAPQENDPASSRHPGYRMPRIVADLAANRYRADRRYRDYRRRGGSVDKGFAVRAARSNDCRYERHNYRYSGDCRNGLRPESAKGN